MKDITKLSWNVDEKTYRDDTSFSYSLLAKHDREGFNGLKHLYDKIETPSLTFGSAVDAFITGGKDEFNERFVVKNFKLTNGGLSVCSELIKIYKDKYSSFNDIPRTEVSEVAKSVGFWKDDKWDSKRYDEVLKTGNIKEYYEYSVNDDRQLLSMQTYKDVIACVYKLRTSTATEYMFRENCEFDNNKRYYQLKFKTVINGVRYKCMFDEIMVNDSKKTIQPIDLKTSSSHEWDFYKSFVKWSYHIQGRLYYRILKDILSKDEYFKDFEILDYKFVVINKESLTPLVWKFEGTKEYGTMKYHNDDIKFRDPFDIAKELQCYINTQPEVPLGIHANEANLLETYINEYGI